MKKMLFPVLIISALALASCESKVKSTSPSYVYSPDLTPSEYYCFISDWESSKGKVSVPESGFLEVPHDALLTGVELSVDNDNISYCGIYYRSIEDDGTLSENIGKISNGNNANIEVSFKASDCESFDNHVLTGVEIVLSHDNVRKIKYYFREWDSENIKLKGSHYEVVKFYNDIPTDNTGMDARYCTSDASFLVNSEDEDYVVIKGFGINCWKGECNRILMKFGLLNM